METSCVGDAIERLEGTEAEELAVGFLEGAAVESAEVTHLEAFDVEILELVEVTRILALALGSFGCSPDFDSASFLEYSFLDEEKESCWRWVWRRMRLLPRVHDCDRAVKSEFLEGDVKDRLSRANFDQLH